MAGTPLEVFDDFMLSTGPAIFSGPEELINEATKNTYILSRFLRGKDMSAVVQGGSKIRDQIFFDEESTFQDYIPNESFTYENPQVLDQWEIPWRFSVAHMSWTDQEIGLNSGDMSRSARFHKYKTLKRSKEMNLWTSMMNGLEEQLWASPDAGEMETTTGRTPYSISSLVNEHSAARFAGFGGTAAEHPGMDPVWIAAGGSTVQGINPTTQRKWQNQKEIYVEAGTQGTNLHLFQAMDRMWKKLRFDALPVYANFSERPTNPGFIACSLSGSTQYENALRQNQDWFRYGGQDAAYPHPTYRNVDVIYISDLDEAALYTKGSGVAYAAEDGVEALTGDAPSATEGLGFNGPRYYFLNGKYMKKTIHRERYFTKKEPFSPSSQPYTRICPVDIWHNNNVCSRQRLGIISPAASL